MRVKEEACQICGRPAVAQAIIAGAKVPVCERDGGYGQVLTPPATPRSSSNPNAGRNPLLEYDLVENYARLIKNARTANNLSLEQLSHAASIRQNELHAFEEGRTHPTVSDAQKLERALKITLLRTAGNTAKPAPARPTNPFGATAPVETGGFSLADRVTIKPLKK